MRAFITLTEVFYTKGGIQETENNDFATSNILKIVPIPNATRTTKTWIVLAKSTDINESDKVEHRNLVVGVAQTRAEIYRRLGLPVPLYNERL